MFNSMAFGGPPRLQWLLFFVVLLLKTNAAHAQRDSPCSISVLNDGDIMYGFPECDSPDTKDPLMANVFYDPGVTDAPKDVLITVRALYGDVTITVTGPKQTLTSQEIAADDVPPTSLFMFSNVSVPGNFSMVFSGDAGYTKWQVAAFSQPSNVAHNVSERALFKSWASACCPEADQNEACSTLSSWAEGEPDAEEDACHTEGNICDSEGHLVRLGLSSQASGNVFPSCNTPPPALSQFKSLKVLHLPNLYVNWTMDDLSMQLAELPQLEELVLDKNVNLHGSFFMAACQLFNKGKTLRSFSAVTTGITGNIPSCMLMSPQLEELNLFGTTVSGEIPDFGADIPLMYLNISTNAWEETTYRLSGSLPRSINASKLNILALRNNRLNGSLPDFPKSLQVLVLQDNHLSGSIPASLFELQQLTRLHLEHNRLEGSIAPALGTMQSLEDLWLTANQQLSGTIDFEWSNPNLLYVQISNTSISGAIPASLAINRSVRKISITENPGIDDQTAFASALTPSNDIVWYNVSSNAIKDIPEGLGKLAAFTDKRFCDLADDQDFCLGVFDVTNNGLQPQQFPDWLLTSLPDETFMRQLDNKGRAVVIDVAADKTVDSNRLPCPDGRNNLQAGMDAASSIASAIYCQKSDGTSVTLEAALADLAKQGITGTTKQPTTPPSNPTSSQSPAASNPSDASSSNGSPTTGKTAAKDQGKGNSDDLGLILGCAFGALVLAGLLFFFLFRYVLGIRKNPFVKFQDNNGEDLKYPAPPPLSPPHPVPEGVNGSVPPQPTQENGARNEHVNKSEAAQSTELARRDLETGA